MCTLKGKLLGQSHQLDTNDLKDSVFTNIIASSTKETGKKLAIVTRLDNISSLITDIHVLKNTNGNSQYNVSIVHVGTNLAQAIDAYNSLP